MSLCPRFWDRWHRQTNRRSRAEGLVIASTRASTGMPGHAATYRQAPRNGRFVIGIWLARKGSNLRSSDPVSVYRNQAREPPFERAAGLSRPPNRGELGAHPENESDTHSENGKSLLPYLGESNSIAPCGAAQRDLGSALRLHRRGLGAHRNPRRAGGGDHRRAVRLRTKHVVTEVDRLSSAA
jgi:hypothetical protein